MYDIKPTLGLGLEVVNRNDILKGEGWTNSIFYAGPTLNYRGNRWFVVLNYLPQLVNVHKTKLYPNNRVLDDHEKREARIIFGITL
jgi:hypothetical protein